MNHEPENLEEFLLKHVSLDRKTKSKYVNRVPSTVSFSMDLFEETLELASERANFLKYVSKSKQVEALIMIANKHLKELNETNPMY